MMKQKDAAIATSLVIQGYLRANSENHLAECLTAIRQEVADWAENLKAPDGEDINAMAGSAMTIELTCSTGAPVNRSPQNLITAAVELMAEAVDLNGPESTLAIFQRELAERLQLGDDATQAERLAYGRP